MAIKHQHANVSASGKRRRELLAGSALAGGVLALMLTAMPQSANALCALNQVTLGASPELINCTTPNFATVDVIFHGGTGAVLIGGTNDRAYWFDQTINATVNAGTTVTGFGLE